MFLRAKKILHFVTKKLRIPNTAGRFNAGLAISCWTWATPRFAGWFLGQRFEGSPLGGPLRGPDRLHKKTMSVLASPGPYVFLSMVIGDRLQFCLISLGGDEKRIIKGYLDVYARSTICSPRMRSMM